MFHLSDSIDIKDCCNQAQCLNKEIITKCLAIKIFARDFLQLPIKKNIIATLCIVAMEKPELTFPLIYNSIL